MTADEMRAAVAAHWRPACPSTRQVGAMFFRANVRGDTDIADFLCAAAFTGLRAICELAKARPEHFDRVENLLYVPAGKRVAGETDGRPRIVPVLAEARIVLASRALAAEPGGLLFTTPTGRAWTRQSVSRAYCPVRDAVGAPGSFHSLRHHFATYLLDRGVSELDTASALGHYDRQGRPHSQLVREVYGHADHAEAINRIQEAVRAA